MDTSMKKAVTEKGRGPIISLVVVATVSATVFT